MNVILNIKRKEGFMKKEHRDISVSRFETFTDDFHFDNCKAICNLGVNFKEKTIRFTHESGDALSLYVVLLTMSVNKTWLQILDSFNRPADMKRYFLLTRWINFESSDFYLCHDGVDGLAEIEKCLIKCIDGGGISSCTLSPLDYLKLVEYDSRFGFTTPESRLKELRTEYKLRYIK